MEIFKKKLMLNLVDTTDLSSVKNYLSGDFKTFNSINKASAVYHFIEKVEISEFFINELALYSPFCSYYALRHRSSELTKSQINKLEDNIALSPRISFAYSINIKRGRFPKGEKVLMMDSYHREEYLRHLKRIRENVD